MGAIAYRFKADKKGHLEAGVILGLTPEQLESIERERLRESETEISTRQKRLDREKE